MTSVYIDGMSCWWTYLMELFSQDTVNSISCPGSIFDHFKLNIYFVFQKNVWGYFVIRFTYFRWTYVRVELKHEHEQTNLLLTRKVLPNTANITHTLGMGSSACTKHKVFNSVGIQFVMQIQPSWFPMLFWSLNSCHCFLTLKVGIIRYPRAGIQNIFSMICCFLRISTFGGEEVKLVISNLKFS